MRCFDREMAEECRAKGDFFRVAGHRIIIIVSAAAHLSNRGIAARASKNGLKRDGRACLIY